MGGKIIYPPPRYSVLTVSRPVSLPVYTCWGLWCPHYAAVTVQYSTVHFGGSTVQCSTMQYRCRTGEIQVNSPEIQVNSPEGS